MTTANQLAGYASSLPNFRNKIINGHLKSSKVLNQRGASSITGATGYTFDRWYYDGSTYLYQGIEDANVQNGTYVISWEGSGISAAWKVSTDNTANNGPDATTGFTSVSNGGTFIVNEGTEFSKHLWIQFSGTLSNLDKVQVELGTVATPFEHRPIGVELGLCQRYYQNYIGSDGTQVPGTGVWRNGTRFDCNFILPVLMRSTPDIVNKTNLGNLNVYSGGSAATASAVVLNGATNAVCALNVTSSSGTAGNGGYLQPSGASAGFSLEAEL